MTDKFYNGRRGETLSNFESVGVFMHTFNQEVKHEAEFPSKDICKLRVELIAEELGELKEAIRDKDIVEIYREDGKVLKGQNYFDPDLITIVQGDNNGKETNE